MTVLGGDESRVELVELGSDELPLDGEDTDGVGERDERDYLADCSPEVGRRRRRVVLGAGVLVLFFSLLILNHFLGMVFGGLLLFVSGFWW